MLTFELEDNKLALVLHMLTEDQLNRLIEAFQLNPDSVQPTSQHEEATVLIISAELYEGEGAYFDYLELWTVMATANSILGRNEGITHHAPNGGMITIKDGIVHESADH